MSQSRQVATQRVGGERGVGRAVDDAAYYPSAPSGGGTGTVTSVDVSGGTTGLTVSGGPIIAAGTLTLGGTLASGSLPATADMNARIAVEKAGVAVGTRRTLNFIEGANVTLTMADDAGNEEVDITIAASGGGGGSVTTGTTTVDFGTFPGSPHTSVVITGQASILAGSVVRARLYPTATADHAADEHIMAASMLDLIVSDIVAGTGFTVHALARPSILEPLELPRPGRHTANATVGLNARPPQGVTPSVGGKDTSWLWGQFTIVWEWS